MSHCHHYYLSPNITYLLILVSDLGIVIAILMTFQAPHCDTHPHSPSAFLSLNQPIRRVCEQCHLTGDRYVVGNQQFQSLSGLAIAELLQTEEKALSRHEQLRQLAVQTKAQYGVEDDALLQTMLQIIESESRTYKQASTRVQTLRGKLKDVQRMIGYFRALSSGRLIEIKMNLASQQGMRHFYSKCTQYAGLIRKGVHTEFKKIEVELLAEEEILKEIEESSMMAKLRQCLINRKLLVVAGKDENKPLQPNN